MRAISQNEKKMFQQKTCKKSTRLKKLEVENFREENQDIFHISYLLCDAMMHVLKDSISLKYSELLTKPISKCNLI